MAKRITDDLFRCPRCGLDKPRDDYYANRSNKHGVQNYCKPCWDTHPSLLKSHEAMKERKYHTQRKSYWTTWVAENREQYNATKRAQYHRTIERSRERAVINAAKYREANREKVNAYARAYAAANPERNRERARLRKARKLAAVIVPYRESDILERDGWVCGICREPIDRTLPRRHPFGASLDHIIPLARGGADAPDNVQAAHFRCNLRKHAKVA